MHPYDLSNIPMKKWDSGDKGPWTKHIPKTYKKEKHTKLPAELAEWKNGNLGTLADFLANADGCVQFPIPTPAAWAGGRK